MKKLNIKAKSALLLFIYLLGSALTVRPQAAFYTETYAECEIESDGESVCTFSEGVRVSSRIYELFFGGGKGKDKDRPKLCPGGEVFGLLINEDGVTVTSGNSRSLFAGDRIISINGKSVTSTEEVNSIVSESGGKRLEVEIVRAGERMCISTTPKLEGGEYSLGVNLRSRTAGIGTVTFVDPKTGSFGGLGHGIGSGEGSGYVTIKNATVNGVTLGGCKRGEPGRAGELTGVLKRDSHGSILINNECGVFGYFDDMPSYASEETAIPIAYKSEVKAGEAEIISTVRGTKRQTYKIEIYDIDEDSEGSKSFKIKVTDPTLISLTGGIVRGMSGSPIIQDGKLVGAVTHVLVANPTEGYGIFIENMLSAAQNQVIPKAA